MFQVVKRLGCAEKLTKGLEARLSGLSAMQVTPPIFQGSALTFADPDPIVFISADPDPTAFSMPIRIQLKQMLLDFLNLLKFTPIGRPSVPKKQRRWLKSKKKHGSGPNLLQRF